MFIRLSFERSQAHWSEGVTQAKNISMTCGKNVSVLYFMGDADVFELKSNWTTDVFEPVVVKNGIAFLGPSSVALYISDPVTRGPTVQ